MACRVPASFAGPYEARAPGFCTGMRIKRARKLCRNFIQVPARPVRYASISAAIACPAPYQSRRGSILGERSLSRYHPLPAPAGTTLRVGYLIKQNVFEVSQLKRSVSVSGDKTTANYATKLHKPDGLTVIAPQGCRRHPP